MSAPTLLNCRGVSLLKVGESPSADPEQEEDSFVSVHQLSLYLWELFKIPRGSVQKKIRDLGITLYPCSREGVQVLRDQCVISAYKACQLTLREAELVFDAVKKSWLRRANSEKRKQENAEKRWLQKIKNQGLFSAGLDSSDANTAEENRLEEDAAVDGDSVDGCVLYRTSSPPTTSSVGLRGAAINDGNFSLSSDGKLGGVIKSELGNIIGGSVGDPFNSEEDGLNHNEKYSMATSKDVASSKNELQKFNNVSSWNGLKKYKKVSSKRQTAEKSQPKCKKRKGSVNGQYQIPPSPVFYSSEEDSLVLGSSGMELHGCSSSDEDEDEEEEEGSAYIEKKFETKLKILVREPKPSPLDGDLGNAQARPPVVNKRIVKLRHFAKNTSPKVKTTISKPPCPSAGKHFPSVSSKSKCKPLIVSIPMSMLNNNCKKSLLEGNSAMPAQMPSGMTLVWSASRPEKTKMKFRGKVKETALSMFASKKRASTHTPPPFESRPEKHPKLISNLDSMHHLPQKGTSSPVASGPPSPRSLSSKIYKPRSSSKSSFSSSSNSPQPTTPCSGVEFPGGDFDTISLASLESASVGKMQGHSEGHNGSPVALKQQSSSQALQKRQRIQNGPDKGEDSFCFRKHFDFIPPRLVVRDGQLCPDVSLSLKGVKFNDIPRDHPIWTWKVGQPTKKALPSLKLRTTRLKTLKSKPPVLSED